MFGSSPLPTYLPTSVRTHCLVFTYSYLQGRSVTANLAAQGKANLAATGSAGGAGGGGGGMTAAYGMGMGGMSMGGMGGMGAYGMGGMGYGMGGCVRHR